MDLQRTVSSGFELTPDLLAAQGRALRGLARSLLGDSHAAEDVVQETWLACLKRPDLLPVRVSGWLGTVTKHLALHRLRGESRRRARELCAADPERGVVARDSLEREETVRVVTAALLELEEPFKTALLLRYYEDRTPSEIAAALGLPLATLKSRLARGLEKLRAKVMPRLGDEERRLRVLACLTGVERASVATTGGATIGTGAWNAVSLAAGVLAVVVGAAWLSTGRSQASPTSSGASRGVPLAATDPSILLGSQGEKRSQGSASVPSSPQRELLSSPPGLPEQVGPSSPAAGFTYRITGQVRDEFDRPCAGAVVSLAPRRLPFQRAAETDELGRFAFEFIGRWAALDVALAIEGPDGRTSLARELHLVSGTELQVDFGLGGTSLSSIHLAEGFALHERTIRDRIGVRGAALEMEPLPDGRLLFVAPGPRLECGRAEPVLSEVGPDRALVDRLRLSKTLRVAQRLHAFLEVAGVPVEGAEASPAPPTASVSGVVRDGLGRPIPSATVTWSAPDHAPSGSTTSDAQGWFQLVDLPLGLVELVAGGGDHGLARQRLTLEVARDHGWEPVLDRGEEVRGRLEFPGAGLGGVRLELWSRSPSFLFRDTTFSEADGSFAFPNVPAVELELLVFAPGEWELSLLPVRVVPALQPGTDLGAVALEQVRRSGEVSVRVLDAKNEPCAGLEARLWQGSSGCLLAPSVVEEEGRVLFTGLPPGEVRVEVGSGSDWVDLGSSWIEPSTGPKLDLGTLRLPGAGLAKLELAPLAGASAAALDLALSLAHPDVLLHASRRSVALGSAGQSAGQEVPLLLAAGQYELTASLGAQSRASLSFRVEPSALVRLGLSSTGEGALELALEEPTQEPFAELRSALDAASCAACHIGVPAGG